MIHLPELPPYMQALSVFSLFAVVCGRLRNMVKAASDLAIFVIQQMHRCAKEFRQLIETLHHGPWRNHRRPRVRGQRPIRSRSRSRSTNCNGCSRRQDKTSSDPQ